MYAHRITKSLSNAPRRAVTVGGVVALATLSMLLLRPQTPSLTGHVLSYQGKLESDYAHVIVKDCISRLPTGGRTTRTEVRSAGVSYVSWSADDSSALHRLRPYPPVRVMGKFNRPATLLDVGANIGKISFPVMAMSQAHTVIAIEPVRENVDELCMNANLNGWLSNPRFVLVQAAMSDKDGEMQIFVPEGRGDNAALSESAAVANVHVAQHPQTIHTISGDAFLEAGGFTPDVIKIDTQGHEIHVLRGLKRFLARASNTLVIAESDPKLMKISGVDPKHLYLLMVKELGYTPYYTVDLTVLDDVLQVTGEQIPEDVYPTRTVRDIYYFK